jgi:hypothetical protein
MVLVTINLVQLTNEMPVEARPAELVELRSHLLQQLLTSGRLHSRHFDSLVDAAHPRAHKLRAELKLEHLVRAVRMGHTGRTSNVSATSDRAMLVCMGMYRKRAGTLSWVLLRGRVKASRQRAATRAISPHRSNGS